MSKGSSMVWMSVDEAYGREVSGGYAPDPLCIACRQGISGMFQDQDQPGEVAEQQQSQAEQTNAGGSRPIIWDHAPSEPIEHVQVIQTRHNVTGEFQRINQKEWAGR